MVKLFINVRPRNLNEVIDDEILKVSLMCNDVKVPDGYLWECEFDRLILKQAINLSSYLESHGINIPIGLTCDPNDMYQGYCLIIDATNVKGSLNAIVSQFFSWTSIENQYIMDFDELVKDTWDGNF